MRCNLLVFLGVAGTLNEELTGDTGDSDYADYLRFLERYRSKAERRQLNSHTNERFLIFKENLL